jgi:hypothetical protein
VAHRTVRCASGATATTAPTVTCNAFNALQCALESEQRQKAHRTVYRRYLVHHRTARRPHLSELQRSNPNGRVMWLAHRTVSGGAPDCPMAHRTVRWRTGLSGAPCDRQPPNGHFWWWGYKYPNHPTIHCIQVLHLPTHYKSYSIQF